MSGSRPRLCAAWHHVQHWPQHRERFSHGVRLDAHACPKRTASNAPRTHNAAQHGSSLATAANRFTSLSVYRVATRRPAWDPDLEAHPCSPRYQAIHGRRETGRSWETWPCVVSRALQAVEAVRRMAASNIGRHDRVLVPLVTTEGGVGRSELSAGTRYALDGRACVQSARGGRVSRLTKLGVNSIQQRREGEESGLCAERRHFRETRSM